MKLLMVMTSHDKLGDTGRKTGFWLEEFAAPYYTFLDAGAAVTVASPKGGEPPLDPKSDTPDGQTEATKRFKKDRAAQAVLASTIKLADVRAEGAAGAVRLSKSPTVSSIAATMLALLLLGIRNAWDLATTLAQRAHERRT